MYSSIPTSLHFERSGDSTHLRYDVENNATPQIAYAYRGNTKFLWDISVTEHALIVVQLYTRCFLSALALFLLMVASRDTYSMPTFFRAIISMISVIGLLFSLMLAHQMSRIGEFPQPSVRDSVPLVVTREPFDMLTILTHSGVVSHLFFVLLCICTQFRQWYSLLILMLAVWFACIESFTLFQAGCYLPSTDNELKPPSTKCHCNRVWSFIVKLQPLIVLISIYMQRVSNGSWTTGFKVGLVVFNLISFIPVIMFIIVQLQPVQHHVNDKSSFVLICVTTMILVVLLIVYSIVSVVIA
jgi:hypothetical protein